MSLQVLVNGFDITNGVTHFLNYRETEGLFDPAALVDPEMVDTFEGPFRVRQTTTDYGMRSVRITGRLNCRSASYADKLRALDSLQAIYAPRPSRVVVGTLELSVDFGRVQISADEMKRLSTIINYTVEGTAIPATFACVYGAGTGLTQGIPVDTQRVNEAAILAAMATGVGTITNPGDVPTPAVLTIQGAAGTVYYLATSATGRRVPISTDANGVGRIDERAGLYLAPGVNRITAYQAATGTATLTSITVMSFFGTTWRYSGNVTAGTATRFDLGPALTVNRTGSASYWTGTSIAYAGDDEPRIGFVSSGTGVGGLVLEGEQVNRCLQSQDLSVTATWTQTATTTVSYNQSAPDGTLTAFRGTSSGDASVTQSISGLSSGSVYTFSVWLRVPSSSYSVDISITDSAGSNSTSCALTTTWTRFIVTRTLGATTATVSIGGGNTWTSSEVVEIWGAQLELAASPSSYIATATAAVTRRGDVAGIVSPHNLALYSDTQTNSAWAVTGWSVASTPVAGPVSGLLNAYRVTTTSTSADNLRQAVTIAGGQAGGKVYTFSVWIRTPTLSPTTSVVIHIEGLTSGSYTSRANAPVTLFSTWQRYQVTAAMASTDTDVLVKIRTANAAGTIDVYGAQLTEGYLPGRYVRTTDAQVLPTTMLDGAWSQNGYIEADFRWEYNSAVAAAQYMFGDSAGTVSGGIRFDAGGSSTNTIRFLRYWATGSQVNATFTDATFASSESGRVRLEWTNYVLGGVRYMYLRIYTVVAGVATLRVQTNHASTVGSLWSAIDVTRLSRLRATAGDQGTISNLVIGTPTLPTGAIPAGI